MGKIHWILDYIWAREGKRFLVSLGFRNPLKATEKLDNGLPCHNFIIWQREKVLEIIFWMKRLLMLINRRWILIIITLNHFSAKNNFNFLIIFCFKDALLANTGFVILYEGKWAWMHIWQARTKSYLKIYIQVRF